MRAQPEYLIHVAFYEMCQYHKEIRPYIFAIEHGENRPQNVGAKLKKKGVRPGIADYFFLKPNKQYGGLWIEFKFGRNKQTKFQKEFEEIVSGCNYKYVVCYGPYEGIKTIKEYLKH